MEDQNDKTLKKVPARENPRQEPEIFLADLFTH
jgi:hypothetical protein